MPLRIHLREVMNLKNRAAVSVLLAAMVLLILDSRAAARSALEAMELCRKTLIPTLFPLLVLSSLLVPKLSSLRIPLFSRLLMIPAGSEAIVLLGCAGGFPVGAACIAQAVETGGLSKKDANRMLGLCSFCGPAFLFGVIGSLFSLPEAAVLFIIQLETALLVGAFWPGEPGSAYAPPRNSVDLPAAVRRSVSSMASVCAWVMLSGVAAGFLDRWLFPLLPSPLGPVLTGLLELTNGVFSLYALPADLRFLFCAVFVCFGGVSVLLQIGGLAAAAGLSMSECIRQKAVQALLGGFLALLFRRLGPAALFLPLLPLFAKIAVEIPGAMVYNTGRKEGI